MIKAVVFDCFGVLVGQGFGYTYAAAGGDASNDRQFIHSALQEADSGQISQAEFDKKIASKIGISTKRWQEIASREEQINRALVEYIADELKPRYKIGLLSNANSGLIETRIPKDILDNLFDSVVVSADIGLLKPDPEAYRYTAKDLEVNPEDMVFIDDVASYTDAAAALGIKTIIYKDLAQCKSELAKILNANQL